MKRLVALGLIALFACTLAACGTPRPEKSKDTLRSSYDNASSGAASSKPE